MIFLGVYFLISLLFVVFFYNIVKDKTPQETLGSEDVTVNHVQVIILISAIIWPLFLVYMIFVGLSSKGKNE